MDKLSRQQFESAFMDIFGNPSGIITQENIRDLDIGLKIWRPCGMPADQ